MACFDAALDALDSLGDDGGALARGRVLMHRAETLRYRIAGTWTDNVDGTWAILAR